MEERAGGEEATMRGLVAFLAPAAALAVEYPAELFHADKIDAVIEQDATPESLFGGLHFNLPEAFGDVHASFLELRESIQAGTKAHAAVDPVDGARDSATSRLFCARRFAAR